MADNPFQSALNPRSQGAGLWDLRMMSAANRMETPFERGMRGPGHGGVSGNPMFSAMAGMANEPDYSQFTYDPVMRQRAIAAGVSPLEANQVQQNVLLPNSGFFGRHPNLSRALEGGLFAAAATPSSGGVASAGENISHAIEGMIGGERMRQGLYRQQFARPFEAAGALEQLNDMKQRRDLQSMEIEHMRAENQKLGRPDHDMRPMGNAGPQDKFIPIINNTTGQMENQPNPNYDPALVQQMHRQAGAGTDFDRWVDMRNSERKQAGKPPLNSSEIIQARGQWGSAAAGPSTTARGNAEAPFKAGAARENWIKQQVGKPGPIWMSAGVSPGDKDAAQKLGKFYDENIAPSTPEGGGGLQPGAVQDGYIYQGGDPASQGSWKKQ
jgi:hypothetical protein